MEQWEHVAECLERVDEALGRIAAPSTQSPLESNGNGGTQQGAQVRQEPVFLNELATRRDLFIAAALQGVLANPAEYFAQVHTSPEKAARLACRFADAVLEEMK